MNSKQICVCKSNIDDSLKQIWQIESYGVSKETSEILLPKTEQKAIKILDKTVCKETFEHRLDEILWKKNNYWITLHSVNCSFKVKVIRTQI